MMNMTSNYLYSYYSFKSFSIICNLLFDKGVLRKHFNSVLKGQN